MRLAANFIFISLAASIALATTGPYPIAHKDTTTQDYFGTSVADPYRWMEDQKSPELAAWVQAERQFAESYFADTAKMKVKIKLRLTQLWNFERFQMPIKNGTKIFFQKATSQDKQPQLFVQNIDRQEKPQILIDPNAIDKDGHVALMDVVPETSGKWLIYGLTKFGTEAEEIHVKNLATGTDLPDVLSSSFYNGFSWNKDRTGFFYGRINEDKTPGGLFFHKCGTPQDQDKVIIAFDPKLGFDYSPVTTDDDKYLVVTGGKGTDPETVVSYRPLESNDAFRPIFKLPDAAHTFLGNIGNKFYFKSTFKAPNGHIVAVDIDNLDAQPSDILPEQKQAIDFVSMAKNAWAVVYLENGVNVLKIFDVTGKYLKSVDIPPFGKIEGISSSGADETIVLGYQNFLNPISVYSYNIAKNQLQEILHPNLQFDPSQYETKQLLVTSKDGTQVPIFVIYKKGLKLNGKNPTVMTGYGGFAVNSTPAFFQARFTCAYWIEHGGVFVSTILRGGNEFGEPWHDQGKLANKQNVFDDFEAVAKWLADKKYTNPHKLGIIGSSNGGLLTSAVLVQRPELFGAVITQVPVIDMLRYRKFGIGSLWTDEYGDAEHSAEEFNYLRAYSPLHNVKKGQVYPPTLVTTGDHDDIVFPAHAEKFVATLQGNASAKNPIVLKFLPEMGHGFYGMSVDQIIDLQTDQFAFFGKNLGMKFY